MFKKYLTIIFSLLALFASSQSVTAVVTQVPCDNDGIITVTASGLNLPITYTYNLNNGTQVVHSNINSTTDQLTNIPMSTNPGVGIIATDGINTVYTSSYTPPSFSFNLVASPTVCPSNLGTLNATYAGGTTGPFNFVWTNTQTNATYNGNNISAPLGDYSVEIEDLTTGCVLVSTDTSLTILPGNTISVGISTTAANCTDGSATAVGSNGTAPYTYSWNNGATGATITGLTQGNYSVVVTDAVGCQSAQTWTTVAQSTTINIALNPTQPTCLQNDGSVVATASGGTAPYTYSWTNGQSGPNAFNLPAQNTYSVLVVDANGCTSSAGGYMYSNTSLSATATSTPSDCTVPTGTITLNPSGGTAPYSVVWNTSPIATGLTLSNVASGNYLYTITDALGCSESGSAFVPQNNPVGITSNGQQIVCPANVGNISASAYGGTPPYSFVWSNGVTTGNNSGVPPGTYECIVTDANGCTAQTSVGVSQVTGFDFAVATTNTSCLYNNDGTATVTLFGGTAPYTYLFSNGSNISTATGLGTGIYSITVTDANGCSLTKTFVIEDDALSTDCYCTIEGTVYNDANGNCIQDAGENGISNIMIHCSGYGYTFTDLTGHYSFIVPTGSYAITEQINPIYPLSSCQLATTNVNVVAGTGCSSIVNFANDIIPVHDLKISAINSGIPPVPGNTYWQNIIVENIGSITENTINVSHEHDGQLQYNFATIAGINQAGSNPNYYLNTGGFPTLAPGTATSYLANYSVPTNITVGNVVDFHDSIAHTSPIETSLLLDNTPINNTYHHDPVVVASYDPNYKEVYPKGVGLQGVISSQVNEFDYTIHFQNEGTYFAQNIVITDQLDDDFDWTTLRPGYSDYNYTVSLSETGLLTFTFPNINLPWKSAYGDVLSSGFVQYSIDRKDVLPQGTEFTNTANIYFDYNPPIITNTTINTLMDSSGVSVDEINANTEGIDVTVYPVPTDDMFTLMIQNIKKSQNATIQIVDLMGNIVRLEEVLLSNGTNYLNQNVTDLSKGNYLIRLHLEEGEVIVKKVVIL